MCKIKKTTAVFSALIFLFLPFILSACKRPHNEKPLMLSTVEPISGDSTVTVPTSHADNSGKNIDTYIILNNENTTINGKGASFSDSVLTIEKGGSYLIKGKLSDGKIVVDSNESDKTVTLFLEGVVARSHSGAPLKINSAGREAHIVLGKNRDNEFSDYSGGNSKSNTESEYTPAVIYSKSDLFIEGEGSLKIGAKYKRGISCEKELSFLGGNVSIESADDAVLARNSLEIKGGTLNVVSGSNGLRTADSDAGKGSVLISGGTLEIESSLDCIQSDSNLTITGGSFDLTSGGGSTGNFEEKGSSRSLSHIREAIGGVSGEETIDVNDAEAVKAAKSLTISSGELAVNSRDDAFYCTGKITVSGGDLKIKTDSSAFFSSSSIDILGGSLSVSDCAEGIEGKSVSISGGSIYINTEGSGFGEKGNVRQSGGTVVAFGSKSGVNGKSSYTVTGGTVFSAGDLPAKKATVRRNAELSVTATFPANTLFAITNEKGRTVFCLSIAKNCKSVWFSSPELSSGETYKIYSGGINTGVSNNGIYYGTQYTPGWLVDSVKAK